MVYKFYIKKYKLPTYVLLFIIFEPSIVAFLLTIEREVLISVFLGIFFIAILEIKKLFLRVVFLLAILFLITNMRLEISLIILLSTFLYYMYLFIRNKSKYTKIVFIFLFSLLFVILSFKISSILELYLRHLGGTASSGGFGALISGLPAIP